MCGEAEVSNVYEEETEIESSNEFEEDVNKTSSRDIYKKKDQPYRKQYCPFDGCDAYFFVKWHLDRHLRKHTNEKPFICTHDDCEKAFTCRAYLNKHIKQVHETEKKQVRVRKVYPCSECGHVFKQKHNLKVHMFLHNGEKPFKCDKCDLSYVSMSKLRRHAKIHNGYPCSRENCDFIASKWSELQKHINQEHKQKFKCTLCDKQFDAQYALTRHLRIHTGQRLPCSYEGCSRSYTNNRNLKTHIRIDHEGLTFSCEHCTKTFRYKSSLTKHIAKSHKTSPSRTVKQPTIFTHRVSYAEKLSGVECCEQELKNILLEDKAFRQEIAAN